MAYNLKGYKIFIASPGGLQDERHAFAEEITNYNDIEAKHRSVIFEAVGWEDTLPGIGRPQSLINEELKQCDYFVLVLHDRWGSSPGVNKNNASSGTEEEYQLAWECYEDNKFPMKKIICLFKSVPTNQLADPGPQLKKVVNFKKEIEKEKKLMYSNFSSLDEFRSLMRKNLGKWLRDEGGIENGGYINPEPVPDTTNIDDTEIDSALGDYSDADVKETIDRAIKYAKQGKLVDAESEFSKAVVIDPSENQLLSYAKFLIDTGQLDKAIVMIDRALHLANLDDKLSKKAIAYGFKGHVLSTRGDLDRAEEMYRKSLEINEKLGRLEGMASDYGNLGIVLKTRGDLDGSKEMHRKSLEINENLGRLEGMASDYGNLGNVLRTRGDLDGAEEMYHKSLEIDENLGSLEGMASQYGNLGNVLITRGDLDRAEEMHRKSLEIDEKLGLLEGMATEYGNLGNVLRPRGDLDGAEEMYRKSLEIAEKAKFAQITEIVTQNLKNLRNNEE